MSAISQPSNKHRSPFWPLLLISLGLVWVLSNIGVLSGANLNMLFRLWPLVLIIIGLQLLVGGGRSNLGTWIGIVGVVLIVALVLVGPSLGWASSADVKTASYSEPLGDTTAAQIIISPSVAETVIQPLTASNVLFEANLRYLGEVEYSAEGGSEKVIEIKQPNQPVNVSFWDFGVFHSEQDLRWNIGLNPNVPLALDVNGGVSNARLDLAELDITRLNVNTGVGSIDLSLPATGSLYNVTLNGGTGSINVTVEAGAAVDFDIRGGVGSVTIDVPDDAAVRVDASTGVGGIDIPARFERISGDEDKFVGDEGMWQTANYENAESRITIHYDGGVGSFVIR